MAETLTKAQLLDYVAANVDLSAADANVTDVDADIQAWAVEGLELLLRIAADSALESYLTPLLAQVNGAVYPDCLKIVRVAETSGSEAQYKTSKTFTAIESLFGNGINSYTAGQQIWSIIKGKVKVFRTATTIEIHHVGIPLWDGTNLDIPNGWRGLIGDFCTAKFKMKSEDLEEAKLSWALFSQGLARFGGFDDLPANVGG